MNLHSIKAAPAPAPAESCEVRSTWKGQRIPDETGRMRRAVPFTSYREAEMHAATCRAMGYTVHVRDPRDVLICTGREALDRHMPAPADLYVANK